ncbi:MAG: hypothetical protein LAN59_00600, partial [Acidobacteriia bacterium]|nr:hypothetical protein [Terriglobia bacterium]
LHAPSFNDAYFSSGTSSNWLLYEWAYDSGGTQIELYAAAFDGSRNMTAGTPANASFVGGSTVNQFSPTTEFLNGANDLLFVSGLSGASPNFFEHNINTFPVAYPAAAAATVPGGTSGIIVDNASTSAQASSIYFSGLGANTAVKLTQAGLN